MLLAAILTLAVLAGLVYPVTVVAGRVPLGSSRQVVRAGPGCGAVVAIDDGRASVWGTPSEHLADGEVPTRAPQSGASRHGVADVDANRRQGGHDAEAEPHPHLEIRE